MSSTSADGSPVNVKDTDARAADSEEMTSNSIQYTMNAIVIVETHRALRDV